MVQQAQDCRAASDLGSDVHRVFLFPVHFEDVSALLDEGHHDVHHLWFVESCSDRFL